MWNLYISNAYYIKKIVFEFHDHLKSITNNKKNKSGDMPRTEFDLLKVSFY